MAIRLAILRQTNETTDGTSKHFFTPCFHKGIQTNWEFQGNSYLIE